MEATGWNGFVGGKWQKEVNVRDFIQKNYTPYEGDDSFLADPTQNTKDLWQQVLELSELEREKGGVVDMDTKVVSTLTSHQAGYLDKSKETIVGVQTDKPFKRGMNVYGGIRMAEKACADNGYTVDPEIVEFFTIHRKTHNAGVFDVYDAEIRKCRSNHIITGLPDAYGRGRIKIRRFHLVQSTRMTLSEVRKRSLSRSRLLRSSRLWLLSMASIFLSLLQTYRKLFSGHTLVTSEQ